MAPVVVLLATVFLAAMFLAAAIAATSFAGGCARPEPAAGRSGDKLIPGVAVFADLDGDGATEQILMDGTTRRLTISDRATVYHSREKWRVLEASLGDTDRNGLLEVATLLDAADGRHLGLFAYVGGEYRERLVTSVLQPRPLSLRVIADGLIVLTEGADPGQTGVQTTTYRWNGFGFTALDPATSR
jgi:hypothetical protein